ncbi:MULTISPECIES: TRAP transporter small permease [Pseudovibrio]|uniref:TRAP transporter small permease n=1 Tax=Stappiaceae TaxID=2821832 RepID=UPI002366C55C|nr:MULTISPECIES: TRAP transporter small permease [Pseudovibrio]MDD7912082.1 TRAP transporter small permease [Pseudovibrio exalbescens]MDX5592432.1 TRAP transporter small permease [Pseudovibrio sp. SPO723]
MIIKTLEKLECGLDYLARFLACISAIAAAAITIIICVSVIMRRVANSPLFFAEELVGLLLCVTMMCALPLVTSRNSHIQVTLVVNRLTERGRAVMGALSAIVALSFFCWLIWEAIPWMEFAIRLDLKTEATHIPMVPWMMVVPVSFSLTALILTVQFFNLLLKSTSTSQQQ